MSNTIQFAFSEAVSKKAKYVNWKHCESLMQTLTQTLHTAITQSIEVPSIEAFTKIMQDSIKTVYVDKVVSDKPKRPLTNFMAYCMENRKQIHEEKPDLSSKKINALLGKMWNKLSQDEKDKYRAPKEEVNADSNKEQPKKVTRKAAKKADSKKADSKKEEKQITDVVVKPPTKKVQTEFASMIRNKYKEKIELQISINEMQVDCKKTALPLQLPVKHTFEDLMLAVSNENLTEDQIRTCNKSGLFSYEVTTVSDHELWEMKVNQIQCSILDVINRWFHIRTKENLITKEDETMYHHIVTLGWQGETFDIIAQKYV